MDRKKNEPYKPIKWPKTKPAMVNGMPVLLKLAGIEGTAAYYVFDRDLKPDEIETITMEVD